ncbi:d14aebd6-ed69-48bb-be98-b66638a218c8 [Sclerotinia trifoliorum]|uniref:D14aebd6-ed69-48bb-be98-b66638a218c8 n=1 Tax=Sclerotinia trifoliorum TaxID=28548 RepID=A0A8H2VNR6_9HELO|nr:d14aebd6-ed69-48bb-be98-b66638a218c8 [Sclerotinia trifoliorum]
MMKILLAGLDLTLPKLPRGTEVQTQVSMKVTHTHYQNRAAAPLVSEEDRKDMTMTNFAIVDQEEKEEKGDKDLIEELHPQIQARLENQESEDKESNIDPIQRK